LDNAFWLFSGCPVGSWLKQRCLLSILLISVKDWA
jgi:hypothetical protein